MLIKEFIHCKRESNHYFSIYKKNMSDHIICVAIFFDDAFGHIRLSGTAKVVEKLKTIYKHGIIFEMIQLTFDNQHDLAYLNEPFEESEHEITPELDALLELQDRLELCHRNLVRYAVMSKENLFHLLLTWDGFVDKKVPYFLMYQDDKDWYDSVAFDTQEAMEQFIADHTKQETIQS